MGRLPALLTVEEAGVLLRIGRTKAYAMAKQWRATGGQAGLPVIDLGHVLRVPRRALEEMVGADLGDETPTELVARVTSNTPRGPTQTTTATQRPRHYRRTPTDQIPLFKAPSPPQD